MSKHTLASAVLGVSLFLTAGADLFAGGRIGGAYSGGGFSGGGAYGGGRYGSPGYGGYGNGLYGGSLFYGDYITGGGYPGYFAPYAYPSRAPYSYNQLGPYSAWSGYPPSSAFNNTLLRFYGPPMVPANKAQIHVVLPDPQATVLIDGNATTTTGGERYFQTTDLTPGETYEYQLRVTWNENGQPVTQARSVVLHPGQTTEAVFTRVLRE